MNIVIDKIIPQKKSKNRYSLFCNEKFVIGVSDSTLLQYNLHIGSEISPQLITEIKNKEDKNALMSAAFRFLSRRQHSVFELKKKLFNKTSNQQLIDQIIKELIDKNYLNDQHFTEALLNEEIKLKKSGPLLIKKKLLQKGISLDIIDTIIINNYSEKDQYKNCHHLALKKLNMFKNVSSAQQKKIKLVNYLRQKGYDWQLCEPVIKSLNLGENNEE